MSKTFALSANYSDEDPDTGHVRAEVDVIIHFNFTPGSPSYYDTNLGGWLPADPEEIEFDKAEIDLGAGKCEPACPVLAAWAESYLDDHADAAREEAWSVLQSDRDEAAERRSDDLRDDRMIERMECRR
jgi:hypothetical protein